MSSEFGLFLQELEVHNAFGYHLRSTPIDLDMLNSLYPQLNAEYVSFITSIGPGRYFSSALVLFSLDISDTSIVGWTKRLDACGVHGYVAIGYDGTTEGCFAIPADGRDLAVYWVNWGAASVVLIAENFSDWVNASTDKYFSSKVYAAYGKISNPTSIDKVISERRLVSVSLRSFDKGLCKAPGKEMDILPRYNRLVFSVKKFRNIGLTQYTVRCMRLGSSVKSDNVEYVSIPISGVGVGEEQLIDCYLFDPFNLPFDSITVDVSPEIDLGSVMRVKYTEIKDYL